MTWLQVRLYLLMAAMFGILYGVIVAIGSYMGVGSVLLYIILAVVFTFFQFLIGPAMVGWTMKVKLVSEKEEPELHQMVAELARQAKMPKPKVGISELSIPNAFAYGSFDSRVAVTRGILNLLKKDELKAVLGHELSHIRHRDVVVMTMLAVVPLILYWIAMSIMWGGMGRDRRGNTGYAVLIGVMALVLYFIANLMVLYASRIREYYADLGSVRMGNKPQHMATALYKLVYGNARLKDSPELKRVQGAKAFFINDPSRAWDEIRDLKSLDADLSGTIDSGELINLRQRKVKLGFADKLMEVSSTHPNMLKRIKHLSSLVV